MQGRIINLKMRMSMHLKDQIMKIIENESLLRAGMGHKWGDLSSKETLLEKMTKKLRMTLT